MGDINPSILFSLAVNDPARYIVTMPRLKDASGFGAMALVAFFVVLCVVAGTGWVVYNHANKSDSSTSNDAQSSKSNDKSSPEPSKINDPAKDWTSINSIGGGFSMKLPDGWSVTNYPGNTINSDDISLVPGKPAVIATSQNAYSGDQKKFNAVLTNKQYDAPQWQHPNQYGTESSSAYSIGSLSGTKYSLIYTQSVIGTNAGDKIYQYVFNLDGGRQLNVVYMPSANDTDILATVEQAIQTIKVN